jgi:hypothetical protein
MWVAYEGVGDTMIEFDALGKQYEKVSLETGHGLTMTKCLDPED